MRPLSGDYLIAIRSSRFHEPMPEAPGKATEKRDLIARRIIDLPNLHLDMRGARDRRVAGAKGARMQIDRQDLGENIARAWPRNADDRAAIALLGNRGKPGENARQALRQCLGA